MSEKRPYLENPKTRGSGIVCCVPQRGMCPNGCADCFFQSGRSYLEPLDENLPNMPDASRALRRVVRVNDGNDSNVRRGEVIDSARCYCHKFYNTAIPVDLAGFGDPVVLTVNPGKMTDAEWHAIETPPENLMFVRIRTNTWNIQSVVNPAIDHYTARGIPVVLTFMAYFGQSVPEQHAGNYVYRTRTLNSYWAITTGAWESVMHEYRHNKWVYSCGKIEGEMGTSACRHCGNCLREYFAAMERIYAASGEMGTT